MTRHPHRGRPAGCRRAVLFLATILVVGAALAPEGAAQIVACPPEFTPVRERIERGIGDGQAPSCAVVVLREGRVVWAEGFGHADLEGRVAATPDTPYRAASISKPFTAAALMMVVERGLVALDDPVNRHLERPGVVSYAGPADGITLRRLANHTAGLPTHWSFFYPGARPPSMEATVRSFGFAAFAPGSRWNYSNLGFGILGHVVERVSRMPFPEFLAREILVPLGMTRTSARPFAAAENGVAAAYSKDGTGQWTRVAPYDFDHPGASVVCTSAQDLARFLRWQLGDGELDGRRVSSTGSVRALRTPTADRGQDRGYAIGWAVDSIRGRSAFGHTGGMPGVATACRAFAETKDGYVVLTNTDVRTLCNDVATAIERVLVPDPAADRRETSPKTNPPRSSSPPATAPPAPPASAAAPAAPPTTTSPSVPPDNQGASDAASWHGVWRGTAFLRGIPVDAVVEVKHDRTIELRLDPAAPPARLRNVSLSATTLVARGELLLPAQEGFPGTPDLELRLDRDGEAARGLAVTAAARCFHLPHRIELRRDPTSVADGSRGTPPASTPKPAASGALVIVGGGGTVPAILERSLALGGGADARVVVLSQASGRENAGRASVERWTALGAKDVCLLRLEDPAAARAALAQATLIWFPGGAQSRLMTALRNAGLVELIRTRHRAGTTIGGTSAGAAVMSEIMIAALDEGATADDPTPRIETGLGLWPDAIVDQHFTQRRREPRLRLAVARHPNRVGVGIDERTALVVLGDAFEVLGEGTVTVVRPRAWPNAETVVLRPGDRARLR